MRFLVLVLLVGLLSVSGYSQFVLQKEVNGVEFYTKWSHEKWWSKKSAKVLLVKVKNTNELAVKYTMGVEFLNNLKMVEESKEEDYCLGQFATAKPRKNGFVFKPAGSDFDSFELTGLEVEKQLVYECKEIGVDKK